MDTEISHLPGFYEPFSSLSHLFGAVLFLFLGLLLLRRGWGDLGREILLGIYASSCVILFALSGSYHMMVRDTTVRAVMERLDHGAIFILIAGTCTPALGILFRGPLRWGMLLAIWTITIASVTLKTIFFSGLPQWAGLSLYLVLGWLGLFPGVLLGRRYGIAFIKPLIWGGVFYSIGATMDYLGWGVVLPGIIHQHELFHLFVLAGAFMHWIFVWSFATGEVHLPVGLDRRNDDPS